MTNQGFTLIELLVVVLVIGILSAVALPQYQTAVERSRATEALTQMSAVRSAMERFHSQHETWPTTFNQLDIDIPAEEGCASGFGGRNFCLSFATDENDGVITAERRRDNHGYTLQTTITVNANGTYSATRSCIAAEGDSDSIAYCNAISGGNVNDF